MAERYGSGGEDFAANLQKWQQEAKLKDELRRKGGDLRKADEEIAAGERQAAAGTEAYDAALRQSIALEAQRRVATRESAAAYAQLDQSMYRHGALTSEFIAATARGETTLRDIGNQVAVTTAKFAGWTAAAGLVYGAYKAIKDVGTGAVETQNAIVQLSRFIGNLNTDRAREQLRQLSQEMNVPIKDVGDAAGQFARVFHNQDEAFSAARASIIATKLDNISAADSYRALTAAVQGFHLSSKDIPGLIDSINASQREFGANVQQIIPGFGRAAGGYAVGGGTPQYLQALLATIIRTTGGQGANVGIALSRAATRFSTQPANVATLAGYGIDSTKGFDRTIDQAFKQIQERQLPRQDIIKIAQAIGGPQFGARYFAGLLENQQLFEAILKNTSPERTKGSAQEELNKKLGSFDEIIKSVGVSLQGLGSELERVGAFAPIKAGIEAISTATGAAADLVGVFAGLDPPLRTALLTLTAILGVMRLTGRFGGAGGLLARVPGLRDFAGADQNYYRRLQLGLSTQRDRAVRSAEGRAGSALESQFAAEAATGRVTAFQRVNAAPLLRGDVAAKDEEAKLIAQREAAIERANLEQQQVVAAQRVALATDQELAQIQQIRATEGIAGVRRWAEQRNYTVPGSLKRPFLGVPGAPPTFYTGPATAGPGQTAEVMTAAEREASVAEKEFSLLGPRMQRLRDTLGRSYQVLGVDMQLLNNTAGGFVGRNAQRVAETGDAALGKALAGGALLKTLPAKVNAGLGAALRSMGLLDGLFLAFIAYSILDPIASKSQSDAQKALDVLSRQVSSQRELQQQAQHRAPSYSPFSALAIAATHPFQPGAVSNYVDTINAAQRAREGDRELNATILAEQAHARAYHTPVPNQAFADIQRTAQREFADYKAGRITFRELQADFAKHAVEFKASLFIAPDQAQQGNQLLHQLAAQATDPVLSSAAYLKQLNQLDQKHLTALVSATTRDLKAFGLSTGPGRSALSHLALQAFRSEDIAINTGTETDVNAFADIQDKVTQAIQQQVESELKANLALRHGQAGRQAAYRTAISQLHQLIGGTDLEVQHSATALNDAKSKLADAEKKQAEAQTRLHRAATGQIPGVTPGVHTPAALSSLLGTLGTAGGIGALGAGHDIAEKDVKAEGTALKQWRDRIKQLSERLKKSRDYRTQMEQVYKAAVQDLRQQQADDISRTLDEDVGLSQTDAQRAHAFQTALKATRALPKGRIRNIEIQKVRDAQYQNIISELDAEGKVREDSASSAGQADQIEIDNINKEIAAARRDHQSSIVINGLIAKRKEAMIQAAQDALSLVQAQGDLSSAGIPSYDTVAKAAADRANAHTYLAKVLSLGAKLGKDYQLLDIKAQADVKRQNQAYVEAVQQQAADLAQARYEYLESLTTDPLKIDRLKIQADSAAVRAAHTQAERYRAEAKRNQDKQALIQDRVSQREDDIQFALDMHKITNYQAEQELLGLLKLHQLTKATRRDIQRKIQSLKDASAQEASGFGLEVGSLKLPTIYDVRRAIHGAIHGTPGPQTPHATVHQSNRIEVVVNDPHAAHKVFDEIEKAMGGGVHAAMRTAGLA